MTIGERIRYLRKTHLKIKSSEEFGKKIGISGSNVGNIETGRVNATDRVISDICNTFSVNENWLRNGGSDDEIFIELSEDEEIELYTKELLNSTDDIVASMIKNFIVMYQKLDGTSKQVLKDLAKDLLIQTQQKQNNNNNTTSTSKQNPTIDERMRVYREYLETKERATEKLSG